MTAVRFPVAERPGDVPGRDAGTDSRGPRVHRCRRGRRRDDLRLQTVAELCAHYRQTIDAMGLAVIALTGEGTIRTWNPGAERLFGYSEDEVRNRSVAFLSPSGASGDQLRAQEATWLRGARAWQGTAYKQHKDGHSIHVLIYAAPICDEEGNCCGAVWLVQDIATAGSVVPRRKVAHDTARTAP